MEPQSGYEINRKGHQKMKKNNRKYSAYIKILKEELIPAMGCTEPIAIAYCAAKAASLLDSLPDKCTIAVSGNIIKNANSVVVPNTNGMKGIEAAAAAGIIAGNPDKALEVISSVTPEQKKQISEYLISVDFTLIPMREGNALDILITLQTQHDTAKVRISDCHTNITFMEKNGTILYEAPAACTDTSAGPTDYDLLNVEDIIEFADTVDLADMEEIIARQIKYNKAISEEGLKNDWGANIGKIILASDSSLKARAKASAAAGSDARMSGCELPVIINSGSGNQGITITMPVVVYAEELKSSKDTLFRALVVANLIAVHEKANMGRLSAYCGAVSAGCAAACGIAYLNGGKLDEIAHTLVNSVAIASGIVCDGAKPSCAAKIAAAVDCGILGYEMYLHGQQFYGGDGIVSKGVENTLKNIGRLGSDGMHETDKEILRIMTGDHG
jgi:L-cysteine desulfidase